MEVTFFFPFFFYFDKKNYCFIYWLIWGLINTIKIKEIILLVKI